MTADAGLLLACAGCCCGRPRHGGELAPGRVLRRVVRRAYAASGLQGRVRLTFTECLGPCSEANVVLLYLHGRPLWFRRMNSPDLVTELLAYARDAVGVSGRPLPAPLTVRSFSWTGGGVGPEPPIEPDGS